MRRASLSSFLFAASAVIALAGCGSDDASGGGGTGATGGSVPPSSALSLGADTALPASAGAATTVAFATEFGLAMSSGGVFGAITSAQLLPSPKQSGSISQICVGGGSANIDGAFFEGETVTITLEGCDAMAFLPGAENGTITLAVERAEGLVFVGDATVALTSTGGGTMNGSFWVGTNVRNVTFGEQAPTDDLTMTVNGRELRVSCFEIYQRYPEFFRPIAVATLDGESYTINDYPEPSSNNISFPDGFPSAGSMIRLASGVDSDVPCFDADAGDGSSCTMTFRTGGCVDITCTDKDASPTERSVQWTDLVSFDFTNASEQLCSPSN